MRARYGCLLAFLMLCGCSGGPSSADVKKALQESYTGIQNPNVVRQTVVEEITNLNCKEDYGNPGHIQTFMCSFNVTSFSPLTRNRSTQPDRKRFVWAGTEWVIPLW